MKEWPPRSHGGKRAQGCRPEECGPLRTRLYVNAENLPWRGTGDGEEKEKEERRGRGREG